MKRILLFTGFIFLFLFSYSQGGIDHIKKQQYMKRANKINCDSLDGDNLSARICANLRFQKSDSLLTVLYKKLLSEQQTDAAKNYLVNLQKSWRKFRDAHCSIIWKQFEGGSIQAEEYLNCLTELTNHRRQELEKLLPEN